jgi:hypothetical protein
VVCHQILRLSALEPIHFGRARQAEGKPALEIPSLRTAGLSYDALEVSWSSPMSEVCAVGKPHRAQNGTRFFESTYTNRIALPIVSARCASDRQAPRELTGRQMVVFWEASQAQREHSRRGQVQRCKKHFAGNARRTGGLPGMLNLASNEWADAPLGSEGVGIYPGHHRDLGQAVNRCPPLSVVSKMRFHAVETAANED